MHAKLQRARHLHWADVLFERGKKKSTVYKDRRCIVHHIGRCQLSRSSLVVLCNMRKTKE